VPIIKLGFTTSFARLLNFLELPSPSLSCPMYLHPVEPQPRPPRRLIRLSIRTAINFSPPLQKLRFGRNNAGTRCRFHFPSSLLPRWKTLHRRATSVGDVAVLCYSPPLCTLLACVLYDHCSCHCTNMFFTNLPRQSFLWHSGHVPEPT